MERSKVCYTICFTVLTMFIFKRALAFSLLSSLIGLQIVISSPVEVAHGRNASNLATHAKLAAPAAPRFVIYSDAPVSGETGPPPVSEIQV
jgi:hypothetical protein